MVCPSILTVKSTIPSIIVIDGTSIILITLRGIVNNRHVRADLKDLREHGTDPSGLVVGWDHHPEVLRQPG